MSSKENLKPLKTLVFSMGLLLVGGTVLLFGIALKKMSGGGACAGGEVELTGRGPIVDSRLDGQVLRLTFEPAAGKTQIVTLDSCSGKVAATLTISTDPEQPVD